MTDSFVTQCPHCHTRFRVSRAQLAVAQGAVRCGACLHVFNAVRQLLEARSKTPVASVPSVEKPKAPVAAAPAAKPVTQPPAPTAPSAATLLKAPSAARATSSGTLWIHDDLDLDSLDLDEELAKLEQEERRLSRDLLGPNAPVRAGAGTPRPTTEAPTETKEHPSVAPADPAAAPPPPVEPSKTTVTRIEPSLSMGQVEDDPGPGFSLGPARDDAPDGLDDKHADPGTQEPPRHTQSRTEPALRNEGLLSLTDEPLHLDWQQPKRPRGRRLGWSLLNLAAALGLTSQYIGYNFEELARQNQYRPWFEQLCPEIGCHLPSKVDVEQIKSSNLVVRSHPEFAGALVVDAILYNRAAFTQPFPLLELRFADINGQLLASRRFKPSEYLSGELAGQTQMPPQTPIHIALDILDPGDKAVNYSLSFHSPD